MCAIGITVNAAPAPNPAAVSPAASPRLSGNHFNALPTQVPYTLPAPIPPLIAEKYSTPSDVAYELMIHDSPARIPPTSTTGRGPNWSISQPSIGVSQVSQSTKIENATWIAARVQPNFCDIGLTKSVQPYCRLAIIAMQMIPMTSCDHRFFNPVFCIGSCVSVAFTWLFSRNG